MLLTLLGQLFSPSSIPAMSQSNTSFPTEYIDYARHAYPSNHTYKIKNNELIPLRQLTKRYHRIRKLFPANMTSLADVGSSKGFFVLAANSYPTCQRSLGIDVNHYDINFTTALRDHLGFTNSNFKLMRLHELADRIEEFGGGFQTILVNNQYQYLYFGSDNFPDRYLDHDIIFSSLRKICTQRVIFNNRIRLEDVQNNRCVELAAAKSQDYTEEKILAAASKYFNVTKHGKLGGYPLWTLDVKP